jgi:hypothetical protein
MILVGKIDESERLSCSYSAFLQSEEVRGILMLLAQRLILQEMDE